MSLNNSSRRRKTMVVRGRLRKKPIGKTLFGSLLASEWRERFFTLDTKTGKLQYFAETETAEGILRDLKGTLFVTHRSTVTAESSKKWGGRKHCFTVLHLRNTKDKPVEHLVLQAKESGARSRWLTTFEATIKKMQMLEGKFVLGDGGDGEPKEKKQGNADATANRSAAAPSKEERATEQEKASLRAESVDTNETTDEAATKETTATDDDEASPSSETSINMSKHVSKFDSSKADVERLAKGLKGGEKQSKRRLRSRAHVLREMVETQRSYVDDLSRCVELYYKPLQRLATKGSERKSTGNDEDASAGDASKASGEDDGSVVNAAGKSLTDFFLAPIFGTKWHNRVSEDDVKTIFGHFHNIVAVDTKLLNDLNRVVPSMEKLQSSNDDFVTEVSAAVGGVVVAYVPFLMYYAQYASNFETATHALDRIGVIDTVKKLLRSGESAEFALDLHSYLVRPLKQLVRIRVFLAKLVSHTDRRHEDFSILLLALHKISTIAAKTDGDEDACEDGIRELIASFDRTGGSFHDESEEEEEAGGGNGANAPKADDDDPPPPQYSDPFDSDGSKSEDDAPPPSTSAPLPPASSTTSSSSLSSSPIVPGSSYTMDVDALLPDKIHPDMRELIFSVYLPDFQNKKLRLVTTKTIEHAKTNAHTVLEVLTDGTRVRHLPTGGAVQFERNRNGCRLLLRKGGICKGGRRDGSRIEIHPNGVVVQKLPDKSTHQYLADGSSVHLLADGTRMQRNTDGTDIFVSPSGTKTQKTPVKIGKPGTFVVTERSVDGVTTTYFPSGAVKLVHPNGQWAQLDSDGTKIEILPDLVTQLQTNPDGVQIFSHEGGISRTVYPNGKSVTKMPDGSVHTIGADGTKKVTTPKGTVKETTPDGRTFQWDR